ncbi:MAG: glycosyltransferase family 2 protein [Peptococcaceae bacterium]|nr:glycosyltransferase family 2 protein [Peptococcaceae bacterium]
MIDILMATYNGEKFLRPQLDSILHQSNQEWRLIIRDDCSTDNTVQIIKEYQLLRPEQIFLIQADRPSGSAQNNFFQLLQYSRAEYVMFADQDDVWLHRKVEMTLYKMQQMELQHGKEKPLLVHTDLAVVDEHLRMLNKSLFQMQEMDAERNRLNNIVVQNIVTGCTMMVNRALLNLVAEIPKKAIMHDMWMALIAAAFGEIGFINRAVIMYRQHGNNANGAKNVKTLKYFLWKLTGADEIHRNLVKQYQQADEFCRMYDTLLTQQQKEMLRAYSSFENKNMIEKFMLLRKYKLYKKGFVRVMGQILR